MSLHRTFPAAIAALLVLNFAGFKAAAAEIHVISPNALNSALRDLGQRFTQETGTVVDFTFGNAGTIAGMLDGDSPTDVVVLPAEGIEALDHKGVLKAGSKTTLGRVEIAFIVRAGAPHPDISTPDKFQAAMLAASLVAVNDPSTGSAGGVVVAALLKDPRFAGAKIKLVPAGPGKVAGQGGAEVALQSMSEVVGVPGIEVVGPVPAFWPAHLDFSAAVPTKSTQPDAIAFLRYITRPEAGVVWKAGGVDR